MKYTIQWDDFSDLWMMNGYAERFVGGHLYTIAKENNLTTVANSESHHLQILRAHGIEIELLEEDGSRVVW